MDELNKNLNDIAKAFAEENSSIKLKFDFSERSIQDLDDFIENLRTLHSSNRDEIPFEVRIALGCTGIYLGEVIKMKTGSQWIKDDNDIFLDAGQLRFNPIGKVFKRFVQGTEDSVYGFYIICINNDIIKKSLKA